MLVMALVVLGIVSYPSIGVDLFPKVDLPIINISTNPTEVEGTGLLVFCPNPSEFVRQIPGLGWVPDVLLPWMGGVEVIRP